MSAQSDHMYQSLLMLRDAMTQLSIALRDYQFEVDRNARKAATDETQLLMHSLGRAPGQRSLPGA